MVGEGIGQGRLLASGTSGDIPGTGRRLYAGLNWPHGKKAMKRLSPAENEQTNNSVMPLLERMDDAVGEATTVMGAVLTELLRRTLRGGVSQIGEGLTAYVSDQVDATIADRTPAIEPAAAEIADKTAGTAAAAIVVDEVRALESRGR